MSYHIEIAPLLDQTPLHKATGYKIQEGMKADHLIDICATDCQGLQTNKSIDERVKDLNKLSTKSCTIFKVNVGLSESNPDAYKPKLISIGPYHNKNPQLRSMENYKLRYVERFLSRRTGINVENCIKKLKGLKDKALECYDIDIVNLPNYSSTQFLEMLLIDGCFVVEYLREVFKMIPEGEGKIINAEWMVRLIDRDLLLLENQLPFFVLTMLKDMTSTGQESSLMYMVKYNFSGCLPKVTPKFLSEISDNDIGITHLLEVVHMCCCPPTSLFVTHNSPKMFEDDEDDDDGMIWHDLMKSATELDEGGVKFLKAGEIYRKLDEDNKEDGISLFDINFKNKVMQIPCFEVVNRTETILRNLVAYEQHSSNIHRKYFTDYAVLMDRIINTQRDVTLLRHKGIIRNRIGDDVQVASIFNKLGEGVIPSTDFCYKEVCRKVIEHCRKPLNEKMANLWHNYFNGPWTGLSTLAAVILLVLTVMQTVLTFMSTL